MYLHHFFYRLCWLSWLWKYNAVKYWTCSVDTAFDYCHSFSLPPSSIFFWFCLLLLLWFFQFYVGHVNYCSYSPLLVIIHFCRVQNQMNLSLRCHVCFSVMDADGRDLLVRELQQLRLAYQKLQDHTLTKEGEVSVVLYPLSLFVMSLSQQEFSICVAFQGCRCQNIYITFAGVHSPLSAE